VLSKDAKQALLDQYFVERVDGVERIEPALPDLSTFGLPRAIDEPRRERRVRKA
jgi:hypothetical protein